MPSANCSSSLDYCIDSMKPASCRYALDCFASGIFLRFAQHCHRLAAKRLPSVTLGTMSRHGADEISGSPELQAKMRRAAAVAEMSAATRDARIMRLHGEGYKPAEIGRAVGMTGRGVSAAIARIRDGRPGRVRAE